MERTEFSTPEDVDLGYELAGAASRLAAFLFDRLIIFVAQLIGFLGLMGIAVFVLELSDDLVGVLAFFGFALAGFGELLYFGLYEWRTGGLTPGKRRVGLRVAMDGGYGLTPTAIILRTVFRAVDMIPIFWIIPALDKKCRRLGDFVAGTLVMRVVEEGNTRVPLASKKYSDLPAHYLGLGVTQLAKLRRSEYASIEEFLLRAPGLKAKQRTQLSREIVKKLLTRLEIESPEGVRSIDLLQEIYLAMRAHSSVLAD